MCLCVEIAVPKDWQGAQCEYMGKLFPLPDESSRLEMDIKYRYTKKNVLDSNSKRVHCNQAGK